MMGSLGVACGGACAELKDRTPWKKAKDDPALRKARLLRSVKMFSPGQSSHRFSDELGPTVMLSKGLPEDPVVSPWRTN